MPDTAHPLPHLTLDLERYRPFLDDTDIPDADKDALLEALWSIIVSFVRLGWGVDAASEALAARELPCGQLAENGTDGPVSQGAVVKSKGQSKSDKFRNAADASPQKASAP